VEHLKKREIKVLKNYTKILNSDKIEKLFEFYLQERIQFKSFKTLYQEITILLKQEIPLYLQIFDEKEFKPFDKLLVASLKKFDVYEMLKNSTTSDIIDHYESAIEFSMKHSTFKNEILNPYYLIKKEYSTLEKKNLFQFFLHFEKREELEVYKFEQLFSLMSDSLSKWIRFSEFDHYEILEVYQDFINEYARSVLKTIKGREFLKKKKSFDRDWTLIHKSIQLRQFMDELNREIKKFESFIFKLVEINFTFSVPEVKKLKDEIEVWVNDILMKNVVECLKGLPSMKVWNEQNNSPYNLPSIAPPPQEWSSLITEYLATLPPHLGSNDDLAILLMNSICKRTTLELMETILKISNLSKDGANQLQSDLVNIQNTLIYLIEHTDEDLENLISFLSISSEEYWNVKTPKNAEKLKEKIGKIRNIQRK
jgi:hypothetical protein